MSRHPPEWQGILDEDEDILWQGQPSPKLRFDISSPMEPLMALFFVAFSVFWMVQAAQAGGVFWMFGLLFFGIGLYQLFGQHIWAARQRQNTYYTLTSKRAIIAKSAANGTKTLDSYPITAQTPLKLEEHAGLVSVFFDTEQVTVRKPSFVRINGLPLNRTSLVSRGVGFELLPDGREVFGLMRRLQNE